MKLFKLPLYFWFNVFGEIREMPQWVNGSLFLVLWVFFLGKNRVICDVRADRYFFEFVHDWIKTGFMRKKEASSYIQNGIYCVLLAINSSKQRKDNQCLARYRWCLLSVYHDLWLVHNRNFKKCLFFISLVDNHISPYF